MPLGFASLDAYVSRTDFTLDAWVVAGRHRHHRTRDHFGADSDLYITIDEAVGNWGGGTPVKYVIADLYDRITRLNSYNHQIRVLYLNGYVLAPSTTSGGRGVKTLDAVVFKNVSSSFTLRALVIRGGSLTINAYVKSEVAFYINAWVV